MTGFDSYEQTVAARTIWGEARGEGDVGMKAVAHVLLNRQKDGRWGSMLGQVCRSPWQFSCWNFEDKDNRPFMEAFGVMAMELQAPAKAFDEACEEQAAGIDPTLGATHYKRVGTPAAWAVGKSPVATIGRHEFFAKIA